MEEQIIDSENWKNQNNFSYREIVLKQVSRVATLGSKEMRKGWWRKTMIAGGSGELFSNYFTDTRKEYISAVEVLHDLLQPKFDDEMEKSSENIQEEIDEMYEGYKKERGDKDAFYNDKLKLMRAMFQELCKFLERYGWLEGGVVEE